MSPASVSRRPTSSTRPRSRCSRTARCCRSPRSSKTTSGASWRGPRTRVQWRGRAADHHVRKWLLRRARGGYRACMENIAGLDPEALNRARLSRDARFDGKFFIAVTSTGIYCRPICPSRFARRSHVRFFVSTAAAEAAGFRPCLRCRPEAAPGTPAWLGTAAVVRRALRLIDAGALDEGSVEALAARLGVGPRHLVRLFARHVGASPIAVAQTRRLHFAVCLLNETDLPVTRVAMASGFGSCRRFNDAFRNAYGRSPRALRRARRGAEGSAAGDEVALRLAYRPPYDWAHVRDFLARRALAGVERVDETGYARTVAFSGGHALISVRPLTGEDALELRVTGAPPSVL